jgi:hypothetical protein
MDKLSKPVLAQDINTRNAGSASLDRSTQQGDINHPALSFEKVAVARFDQMPQNYSASQAGTSTTGSVYRRLNRGAPGTAEDEPIE